MAFEELGLSFLPRGDEAGGPEEGGARLEDIISILSFRLPRILGARPIAPAQLLNAQGGQGNPLGGAIAQAIVQNLQRGMPGGMPQMGQQMDAGAPSPLGSVFGPVFGPNPQPQDIPAPAPPRVIPKEPPAPEPPPADPMQMLRGLEFQRRIPQPGQLFPGGSR